ncbi:MAG: tRNA (N(6)-L-threonylcarbamoyladenosine(37)-C(2))-methylthiotransferase MtaB [Actinobacteria bacterium]|nr:tRNA (N(6)-L-threonylcarbamoyladenosine(37)-C(2))-methylthiotransferase MtaB [Actinomycetota bacterium]
MPKSVAFRTIGCRLNQCETAQMQEALLAAGYRLVGWDRPATVRVVNTCTVTAKSDRTCRHEIRAAKRFDPDCLMVVTGCFAQVSPEAAAVVSGVDLVLGNLDKLRLAEHLAERLGAGGSRGSGTRGRSAPPGEPGAPDGSGAPTATTTPAVAATPPVVVTPYPDRPSFEGGLFTRFHGYTRAFLKIQNGCDSSCAYCIVPRARGPARSMRRAEVLEQVRLLAARGYREVVLTGIDLGSWGHDTGEGTLAGLLEALLAEGGAGRYRLSSIEPLEVDTALLDVIGQAGDRVAHHFHLPLQSGSDAVLRRMGRPYSSAEYVEVVDELARRFPQATLGADVIAGFPGETDEEFEQTFTLIEQSMLNYLHVFSYSDRPGTRAASMAPKITPQALRERSMRLIALGTRKKDAFRDSLRGTEQRVLVLKERTPDGRLVGLTGNYVEVLVSDDSLANRFARVRLRGRLQEERWECDLLQAEENADIPGGQEGVTRDLRAATGSSEEQV